VRALGLTPVLVAAALVALAGCDSGRSTGGTALPIGETPPAATAAAATTPPPAATAPTTAATSAAPTTRAPAPTTVAGVSTQAPAPTIAAAPRTSAAPVSSRCHTSELTASFGRQDPGAGQRYATLVLGNRGHRTCTVYGYGGLQPLDAAKHQLPITLLRDPGHPPRLVRLAPGGQVARTIHWTVVPSGTATCPTPAYAEIIPPDETDPLVIAWPFEEICGGRIDGHPYGVTL
jgi:hypothetical protein